MVGLGCVFRVGKHLKKRGFLEQGYAQNLQNCVEAGLQIEALLEDGDEDVGLDITEAITIGQLCEGHAQVLIETGKALDSVIATIVSNAAAQSMQGKMVDDLCENDLARIHEAPRSNGPRMPSRTGAAQVGDTRKSRKTP